MANGVLGVLGVVLVVQAFFSFGVTSFAHYMPGDTVQYASFVNSSNTNIDITTVGGDLQSNLQRQSNIPVIDVGSLIFFSGNILLDLLLNFVFAVPEMINFLVAGIMNLISVDVWITHLVQVVGGGMVFMLYLLMIMRFLLNLRGGQRLA